MKTIIDGLNPEQVEVIVNFIKNIFTTDHWFGKDFSEKDLEGDISGDDIMHELFSTFGKMEEVNREYDTCSLKIGDREFFTSIRRFGDDCDWESQYFETMRKADMPVVPEKMFILTGEKGEWDAHYEFIVGVFDSMELAEQAKTKLFDELLLLSKKYTTEQAEILEKEWRDAMMASPDDELDEDVKHSAEVEEFVTWPFRHKMQSFKLDKFKITEYTLNQSIFNLANF